MSALYRTGFANIATSQRADDGLHLTDAYILSAVRCAPPDNKPLPEEITRCLEHLEVELTHLPRIRVVVALGKIGFDAWLQLLKRRGVKLSPKPQFGHGEVVTFDQRDGADLGGADLNGAGLRRRGPSGPLPILIGCFHPSRQNTNTGKLTAPIMESVFQKARTMLGS
jgi:uracil-DNA glycosylase